MEPSQGARSRTTTQEARPRTPSLPLSLSLSPLSSPLSLSLCLHSALFVKTWPLQSAEEMCEELCSPLKTNLRCRAWFNITMCLILICRVKGPCQQAAACPVLIHQPRLHADE